MGMSSLNISLPQSLKVHIERQVEEGGYSTPSEYVRDLLRADLKRREEERIAALVREGMASKPIIADKNYWKKTRAELARRLAAKETR